MAVASAIKSQSIASSKNGDKSEEERSRAPAWGATPLKHHDPTALRGSERGRWHRFG